jgi:hypothetical protein
MRADVAGRIAAGDTNWLAAYVEVLRAGGRFAQAAEVDEAVAVSRCRTCGTQGEGGRCHACPPTTDTEGDATC